MLTQLAQQQVAYAMREAALEASNSRSIIVQEAESEMDRTRQEAAMQTLWLEASQAEALMKSTGMSLGGHHHSMESLALNYRIY